MTRAKAAGSFRAELAARVLVAVPAIAVALALVALGGWPFAAALALLGVACLLELGALLSLPRPLTAAASVALAGLIVAARAGGPDALLGAVAATPALLFAAALLRPRASVPALAGATLGVAWIGVGLAHGVLLRDEPHGDGLIVAVMAGTLVGDTGAHLGGTALGRRPLAPAISPRKTVEGLLIGMATAVLAVWIVGLVAGWLGGLEALALGAAIAVAAPAGDLFESFVKREAGVKDSGRLFGAHGGALDRLDALLFAVVAAYYAWTAPAGDLFESFVKREAGVKDSGRLFGAHGGALDRLDALLFAVVAAYYAWTALA